MKEATSLRNWVLLVFIQGVAPSVRKRYVTCVRVSDFPSTIGNRRKRDCSLPTAEKLLPEVFRLAGLGFGDCLLERQILNVGQVGDIS